MVGTDLKAETMKLMDQRTAMELEMNTIIERLCCPNGPGLSGNLVDSEGFPRSDIDVHAVRADRNRLSVLRNDHSDITEKINRNIQVLHSARLASVPSSQGSNAQASPLNSSPSAMDVDMVISRPFAVVDEIFEESPAAEDGLQLGDQLIKVGNVVSGENILPRLAAEIQRNQGHAVPMVVMRQGALVNVSVTPRAWPGNGLLGCHFRPFASYD